MSPKTKVSTYIVNELEVSGLNGKRYHSLPDVYTQKAMPVGTANIINNDTLRDWPYLNHIDIPENHAEVRAIDWYKCCEVAGTMGSCEQGPFAIQTLLECVANGS